MGKRIYSYKRFNTSKEAWKVAEKLNAGVADYVKPFGYKSGFIVYSVKIIKGWKRDIITLY